MSTKSNPDTSTEVLHDEYVLYVKDLLQVKDLLRVLRRRLWVILLVAGVLAGLAVAYGFLQAPTYEAKARMLVEKKQSESYMLDLNQLTSTVAQAVTTQPVAEAVIEELNLPLSSRELLSNLNATRVGDSQFIDITYKGTSPEEAQQVVNTVGMVFPEILSEISVNNATSVTLWNEAALPSSPTSSNALRYGLYALVLGGILGVVLAFILESLGARWRSPEEVEQAFGIPTLGVIPGSGFRRAIKRKAGLVRLPTEKQTQGETEDSGLSKGLVTVLDPDGPASAAYHTLQSSLRYALVDAATKVITVTSPDSTEGKSITCANLAVALSQADKSTLAIDCHLREPAMHRIFDLDNSVGVVEALVGECDLSEAWQEPLPGLKVVTAGSVPPNPADLLGSRRFAQLVERAGEEFDYVLIDAPPVRSETDPTMLLTTRGDGVLLVFDSQNTRRATLRRAVRKVGALGARILGIVIDNAEPAEKR